jgi:hypothetical protein
MSGATTILIALSVRRRASGDTLPDRDPAIVKHRMHQDQTLLLAISPT